MFTYLNFQRSTVELLLELLQRRCSIIGLGAHITAVVLRATLVLCIAQATLGFDHDGWRLEQERDVRATRLNRLNDLLLAPTGMKKKCVDNNSVAQVSIECGIKTTEVICNE